MAPMNVGRGLGAERTPGRLRIQRNTFGLRHHHSEIKTFDWRRAGPTVKSVITVKKSQVFFPGRRPDALDRPGTPGDLTATKEEKRPLRRDQQKLRGGGRADKERDKYTFGGPGGRGTKGQDGGAGIRRHHGTRERACAAPHDWHDSSYCTPPPAPRAVAPRRARCALSVLQERTDGDSPPPERVRSRT
jgi:hypothetical protein